MRLTIHGIPQQFTDIKTFREAHGLPDDFGVATFEPKDYNGLGRIDRAGSALNDVKHAALNAIPQQLALRAWLTYLPTVTAAFEAKLRTVNPRIGLRDIEVEFAVAGFQDLCSTLIFALMKAHTEAVPPPDFADIHAVWLDTTVRVLHTVYHYQHHNEDWQAQTVYHAYGRAGLIVQMPTATHYLHDSALGCPAEGFMLTLFTQVAAKIAASITVS
jgi:hypothetical protein